MHAPYELRQDEHFDAAIVVDSLRTTTTILTALESGAVGVLPGPPGGTSQKTVAGPAGWLWGGEKDGRKPAAFDLGNSPLEMVRPWDGRGLVLQTTNGTRAFAVCAAVAARVYAACLRNRRAVANLLPLSGRVLLCCAGDHGSTSFEDVLTAGAIAEVIAQNTAAARAGVAAIAAIEMDDLTWLALLAWQQVWRQARTNKQGLVETVLACSRNARRLAGMGMRADVYFALDVDASRSVPVLVDSVVRLYSPSVS